MQNNGEGELTQSYMQSSKDGISEATVGGNDMNMMDMPDESELQNNPFIMSYQIPMG